MTAEAEYRDLAQMVEEITTLSRRLSGTSGLKIAASRGRNEKHAYDVSRRALNRLGLSALEDFRPLQRKYLEHLRETCQRVANALYTSRAEKATAAVGYASANILLNELDDIVDGEPHHRALEVRP